jgi:hypothetical protein
MASSFSLSLVSVILEHSEVKRNRLIHIATDHQIYP